MNGGRAVPGRGPEPTSRWSIATRGSALARWQADHVRDGLARLHPHIDFELEIVRTTGDLDQRTALARMQTVGLFTKEIDRAVLERRARVAVHSLKDLPTEPEPDLRVAAILKREDARDAWVPAPGRPARLGDLARGGRVGTSSLRRRALLMALRPDVDVADIRGNLDTRLDRVAASEYDGIILAAAGLHRLDRADSIGEFLATPAWLPAAGQGALAVVVRTDDDEADKLVQPLDHAPTRAATAAERAFLHRLQGGCQIPIGALAAVHDTHIQLHGFVAHIDGRGALRAAKRGDTRDPVALGQALADELISAGADTIVRAARDAASRTEASAP